jgi:hypothetical protein
VVSYRHDLGPLMRHFVITLVLLLFVSASAHAQRGRGGLAAPADGGPNGLGALHFRPLGPEGNRVASITGVPGDPLTVYAGAADGGIWKTTDPGINWRPIDHYGRSARAAASAGTIPSVPGQPRRAASMAAMSIFFIGIIAAMARLASPPPAASASISGRGVICQERPQRSLHQPH